MGKVNSFIFVTLLSLLFKPITPINDNECITISIDEGLCLYLHLDGCTLATSDIQINSASIAVISGMTGNTVTTRIDATAAATMSVQCTSVTCEDLAIHLLKIFSEQYCLQWYLSNSASALGMSVDIQVSFTSDDSAGSLQNSTLSLVGSFNGNDKQFLNGGSDSCPSFTGGLDLASNLSLPVEGDTIVYDCDIDPTTGGPALATTKTLTTPDLPDQTTQEASTIRTSPDPPRQTTQPVSTAASEYQSTAGTDAVHKTESAPELTPRSTPAKTDGGCPAASDMLESDAHYGSEDCGATFTFDVPSLSLTGATVEHTVVPVEVAREEYEVATTEGFDVPSGNQLEIISDVISIDISVGDQALSLNSTTDVIEIEFRVNLEHDSNTVYCVFLANESTNIWSDLGMTNAFVNSTLVRCQSNHLTSFAVLLSAKPPEGINKDIQSYLSRVLGSISIASLILAVAIYCYTNTWRILKIQIHMNLAISTALGQLVFLTMMEGLTSNKIICKAVAVTLQYLFTAALFWTMIEGVFLYRTTAVGFQPLKIGPLCLIAWGGALIVVGASFGARFDSYGSDGTYCWLSAKDETIYIFVGCVFAMLLFNSIMLYFVMRSFLSLKTNMKKSDIEKFKATARAIAILMPVVGLTWFVGVITSLTESDAVIIFQYLFILSFSMQGVTILIFHCLQVPDIKNILKVRFYRSVGDSSRISKTGATSTATSSM